MLIKSNTLRYQFISIPAGRISDEWTIVKNKNVDFPKKASEDATEAWSLFLLQQKNMESFSSVMKNKLNRIFVTAILFYYLCE